MKSPPIFLTAAFCLAVASCDLPLSEPMGEPLASPDTPEISQGRSMFPAVMTRITGVLHTQEDIDRMGLPAVQILISRDMIRRSEAELSALLAQRGGGDLKRIRELEDQIASSREIVEVMTWMETDTGLADGDDDDFCREKPVISSASTPQDIDRGDTEQVRISASGRHSTDNDAMHTVATVTNVYRPEDRGCHHGRSGRRTRR